MGCAMIEQTFDTVRGMSRENLEELAVRAVIRMRQEKREQAANNAFFLILSGFMLGTLVAATGFLLGNLLN